MRLGSPDDLPVDRRLVFFLRSSVPANFPRDEKVEVAADDGSFRTVLALADGSLMLEDAKTALGSGGTAGPLRLLGLWAAAGCARCRPTEPRATGLPLGTLVRLPGFKELRCPHPRPSPAC